MKRYLQIAGLLAATVISTGCQSVYQNLHKTTAFHPFDKPVVSSAPNDNSKSDKKINFQEPTDCAVVWVDSILTSSTAGAIRGFGGRFFFYDAEGKPTRVDGELTIYGFDDSNDMLSSKVPDRKFVFRQEELQSHYAESELGPSYNFWIPWGQLHGPRMTISLYPIFTSVNGVTVHGEQSLNVLPGTTSERASNTVYEDPRGRQVKEMQVGGPSVDSINGQVRLNSSTIEVPPSLARHLSQPQTYRQQLIPTPQQRNAFNAQASSRVNHAGGQAMQQGASGQGMDSTHSLPMPINRSGMGSPYANQGAIVNSAPQVAPSQLPRIDSSGSGQSGSSEGLERTAVYGQPGPIRSYRN